MTSLRQFILNGSSLSTGSAVRDHIKNPSPGGGGATVIVGGIRTANMMQALAANMQRVHTANIAAVTLTTDKPLSLSANINHNFEASICQ